MWSQVHISCSRICIAKRTLRCALCVSLSPNQISLESYTALWWTYRIAKITNKLAAREHLLYGGYLCTAWYITSWRRGLSRNVHCLVTDFLLCPFSAILENIGSVKDGSTSRPSMFKRHLLWLICGLPVRDPKRSVWTPPRLMLVPQHVLGQRGCSWANCAEIMLATESMMFVCRMWEQEMEIVSEWLGSLFWGEV